MNSYMKFLLAIILLFPLADVHAQAKKEVRKGNKLYKEKKYKEASEAYQQALKKDPTYAPGIYNLSNTLYQQQQYEASRKVMDAAAKLTKDKKEKAAGYYNIGNSYMSEQKWGEAIEAYKEALKNNPQDENAKYNLSYALQKLKQQQQSGGKNNKDKKEDKKQDQNKNEQDNKNKRNKDKQDEQSQDKKDKEKEQQNQQSQPSKLSEKQAEQLLNALQQEEKKLHDKKEKGKAVPIKVDKDW